ncbi:pentatricopeptide repeat-containing protein At2g20710, mitochondrial-like isoform X2 [Euphorbia lathyris]|uniref:pentatricopeptide repeat-containing protein At2g20710, mitochondrial-like isoform X2 n=1 Tax=Euphorbia lathyris TaxID=212925 RepID=UPI0033130FDC
MKMNLLVRLNSYLWRRGHRLLTAESVSIDTLTRSFSSSSAPVDSLPLIRRISRAVNPSVSIVPILQQWIDEGKNINLFDLQNSMRLLRKNRRYKQALQISDWMIEKNRYNLSAGDAAIRLDLISRVHGLKEAEKHFNSISASLSDHMIYGSLLSCYVNAKQVEKAEAMMQKMKDMGFIRHQYAYNEMLNLYSQLREHEKFEALVKEMEEKGIECNKKTYTIRLNAYVACSDIEGMETLLMKMEADPLIKMDFYAYSIAANGYLEAGLLDKASMMLKKSEQVIQHNSRKSNYKFLLKQYASVGKKADVYRIWELYKQMGRQFHTGYISIISSLLQLDDLYGAEMIWEEWESKKTPFDIRILNLMINAYAEKGSFEKAEACMEKIAKRKKEPNAISWDNLAVGYLQSGQVMKAVEMIKKAILLSKPGWIPRIDTLIKCLEYLKSWGDKEAADELLKMMNEQSRFKTGTSWDHLVAANLLSGETTEAVEMVKKAILASTLERRMRIRTLAMFLKHLKGQGREGEGAAEELLKMINQHCHFSRLTYNRLVSCVYDEFKTEPLYQMEDDDQNFD